MSSASRSQCEPGRNDIVVAKLVSASGFLDLDSSSALDATLASLPVPLDMYEFPVSPLGLRHLPLKTRKMPRFGRRSAARSVKHTSPGTHQLLHWCWEFLSPRERVVQAATAYPIMWDYARLRRDACIALSPYDQRGPAGPPSSTSLGAAAVSVPHLVYGRGAAFFQLRSPCTHPLARGRVHK
jgi:hypothetical protein